MTGLKPIRPRFFASSGSRRTGAFLGVVLILGITFSPLLRTLAWHMTHGNSILFKGKRINVPLKWIATSETQGATLSRLALTVLSSDKPVHSFITFGKVGMPTNQTPEQIADSFVAVYWTYLAGDRAVKGPLKFTVDSEEVVCMEGTTSNDPTHMEVACLFPTAGLTASMLGEREDRDLFYDTVRSVR